MRISDIAKKVATNLSNYHGSRFEITYMVEKGYLKLMAHYPRHRKCGFANILIEDVIKLYDTGDLELALVAQYGKLLSALIRQERVATW